MDVLLGFVSSAALLGLAGLGWLYRTERERRRAVEEQLSKEKWETYLIFINMFFDLVESTREGKKEKGLLSSLDKFRRRLVVYGSDEVLTEFMKAMAAGERDPDFSSLGEAYSRVIVAIRKDMGNHSTRFSPIDVMRLMMNADFNQQISKGGALHPMYLKYKTVSLHDWGAK